MRGGHVVTGVTKACVCNGKGILRGDESDNYVWGKTPFDDAQGEGKVFAIGGLERVELGTSQCAGVEWRSGSPPFPRRLLHVAFATLPRRASRLWSNYRRIPA